ncbi:hypothetical protein V8E36_004225 [Tilletia maclaganii]
MTTVSMPPPPAAPAAAAASPSSSSTTPRISSIGSSAFSFSRTAGTGVTTGPLHSPNTTRFSFQNNSPPKQTSYFDDSSSFATHSRAKSASISSAFSTSSSSTMASVDEPRTPRLSLSSSSTTNTHPDRAAIISPTSPPAATATATALGRVPSLGLGTASYDAAKSRVLSQPWAPTLGSRWAGALGATTTTTTTTVPTLTPSSPETRLSDGGFSVRPSTGSAVSVGPASAGVVEPAGRLGNLFRKLSISNSAKVPSLTGPTSSLQQPMGSFGTAATSASDRPGFHHHRHHSMSIPPSFRRPSPPLAANSSSTQSGAASGPASQATSAAAAESAASAFGPGGSAIAIDDLAYASPQSSSSTAAAYNMARSEPSSSPVMTSSGSFNSPAAASQARGRKPSFSGGASRKRRPSPTGEHVFLKFISI